MAEDRETRDLREEFTAEIIARILRSFSYWRVKQVLLRVLERLKYEAEADNRDPTAADYYERLLVKLGGM